jgi:hypothetical protein
MSSNTPPLIPAAAVAAFQDGDDETAIREVDGAAALDEDAADDMVDSADADRIASTEPEDASSEDER